ncbi:MAG: hypothetical protein AAGF97_08720, partial [Planctomycetota bacterium]
MNHRLAMRRLWWKETRQLMPLVLMLLGINFFAHFLMQLESDPPHSLLLVGMPLLFSIGAGALLVGQEKELGTLEWFTGLPIASRDIVRVKLLVSIAGLAVMWAMSYLMFSGFRLLDDGNGPNFQLGATPRDLLVFPCQTLFMLLIGLFLAWQFRSSLLSLALLVPLAVIPSLIADQIPRWIHRDPTSTAGWQTWFLGATNLGILLVGLLGWRAGMHCLAATPATGQVTNRPSRPAVRHWGLPLAPTSALLWQFGRQSLGWLGLAAVLCVVVTIAGCYGWVPTPAAGGVLGLFVLISTSWLGTSVFVGDRLDNRIQFLADRGVSPRQVWWTRQALPVCLLLLMGTALAFTAVQARVNWRADTPLIAISVCLLIVVYVSSQWVGQLVRSPIIATLAGPAFAAVACWATMVAFQVIGTPLALIAVAVLLPLGATWCLMSRWMDGRLDLRYWCGHAAFLVAGAGLLWVPLLQPLTEPGMPSAIRSEMAAYVAGLGTSFERRTELPQAVTAEELGDVSEESLHDLIVNHIREIRATLVDMDAAESSPWHASRLASEARRLRWAIAQDASPERIADYRLCIETLCLLAQRLRASHRLLEQDQAAFLTRWLRREAQLPEARTLWTPTLRD